MTAFKNTIAGRILRGVAKVALPVVGVGAAVLTGGAAAGILAGGGALAGIKKTAGKLKTIGQKAVNLVTGTTKNERDQVASVKAESKKAQDQLDQVERLINAGSSRSQAMEMVGITASELGSSNALEIDTDAEAKLKSEGFKPKQAGGCLVTAIALVSGLAGLIFSLILIF